MSLDWDITQVEDWETLMNDEDERLKTEAVTFTTMFVGIAHITKENWKDFALRAMMWERTVDSYIRWMNPETKQVEPLYITAADVKRRIGQFTNASRLTRTQFLKKLAEAVEREAQHDLNYQIRKMEQEVA